MLFVALGGGNCGSERTPATTSPYRYCCPAGHHSWERVSDVAIYCRQCYRDGEDARYTRLHDQRDETLISVVEAIERP